MRSCLMGVTVLGLCFATVIAHADDVPKPAVARTESSQPDDFALLQQKLAERDRLQREIEALRKSTGTCEQILVRTKMVEVNLTAVRKLGLEAQWLEKGQVRTGKLADLWGPNPPAPALTPGGSAPSMPAEAAAGLLDALAKHDVARVLAEPNVVVVSGRPASINVGGEFPVPSGDSPAGVEFRDYGTRLDLRAESLGDDRVRMHVSPRVSELDPSHMINVAGHNVPGVKIRQCFFTTDVDFGQSAVLTGLVQERTEARTSEAGTQAETVEIALMVVVTPELVR